MLHNEKMTFLGLEKVVEKPFFVISPSRSYVPICLYAYELVRFCVSKWILSYCAFHEIIGLFTNWIH